MRTKRLGEDPTFARFLQELKARVFAKGDLPERLPEKPSETASEDAWRGYWEKSTFPEKARRQLDAIDSGAMPVIPYFGQFRWKWEHRAEPWVSAILLGSEGVGKTVIASWAGREEYRSGRYAHYCLAAQIADIIGAGNWDRWKSMRATPLLVIDEIGDIERAASADNIIARIVQVIKERDGADLPTILATNQNEQELIGMIGNASVDRFDILHADESPSHRRDV